ncbi:MAG: type I polyketide synthase [Cyanobacteria bacterium P01_G01_bin.38]
MEPIAIVGMSCRFPGADSPESFWTLLRDGISAIDTVPADRWDVDAYYDPEASPGTMSTRLGGFISRADEFEPGFFGISPREVLHMDPQQRLMLEIAWEALEKAGIVPGELAGSATGVFIGCGNYDFGVRMARSYEDFDAHLGTGATVGIAANRLSYILNLRGPSLTVETACSSSLVAIHLACQSLLSQETDVCLVGASSLMLAPNQTIIYSQAQMLSPDGCCKTFDAGANGYVRGEGCGLVVLKRLVDAQQAGDNILAVIRGTAVNQDGQSNGLTAPNGPAQQAVIRQALAQARVAPSKISYVEAHGTGTPLGDPIEINSLKAVLGKDRPPDQPCWVGSVKTNIGHLEAAAGMAGLIKTVLALQHQEVPPHLNLTELNPYISLEGTAFAIPTKRQAWQTPCPTRLAGVSSFGFGGTNTHVILEEWAAPATVQVPVFERPQHVLALSAKSEASLAALVDRYCAYLGKHPEVALGDVCFTANRLRSHFNHRLSVVSASTQELREKLAELRQMPAGAARHQLARKKSPRVAFVFTGQGSQYVEMGRQLYETQPTFRATLAHCDEILQSQIGTSLLSILYPADNNGTLKAATTKLNQTAYTQPALFALEYALAKLWQSWGVEPSVVMGHSVGEYVAACIAGVFSLEDGLKLIANRGRLMQFTTRTGGMAAVLADSETVRGIIADSPVTIAAFNGPNNTVISGPESALGTAIAACSKLGIKSQRLPVSHAFHSPAMEPMLADFREVAEQIDFHPPKIKLISNLTGAVADGAVATPDYWCEHVIQPVNFAAGAKTLFRQGCPILLEVGPKPVLLGMAQRILAAEPLPADVKPEKQPQVWLPSLRAGREDWGQMLKTLGTLYTRGIQVDWGSFDRAYDRRRLTLPTYPWQRQRYWIEPTDQQGAQTTQSESPVLKWIERGQVPQLVQQLQTQNTFSDAEMALLPKLLDSLVQQHRRLQECSYNLLGDLQKIIYELVWQPQPRAQTAVSSEPGSWLILADKGGLGKALGDVLTQQGHRCRLLYADDVAVAPAERRDALQQVISTVLNNGISPVTGVVSFWSLDVGHGDGPAWAAEACRDTLYLVQSLVAQETEAKLWLVTHRAVMEPSQAGVFQSPLWGLGKVMALEHPELWGGLMDVDIDIQASAKHTQKVDEIAVELLDAQGEDQIAFRDGQRYVARLVPQADAPQPPEAGIHIGEDATYLITGGLGALGLAVANWLVQRGAKQLVLVGRRAPSEAAESAIAALAQTGVKVLPLQADVTVAADMTRVLETLRASLPPLKGVVHAAGAAGYETLQEMTAASFEQVLAPKVNGAWILHQLTESLDLDFFVNFSSIASVWGSKSQAHYAAANQFLDSLAHYRRCQGLSALTVNWGPWAGGGMVVQEFEDWLARAGITPLAAERATAALGQLLAEGRTQATVVEADWSRFRALYELRGPRSLLTQLAVSSPDVEPASAKVLEELAAVPLAQREAHLIAFLQAEVARILGMPSGQQPDLYQGFFEMGLDSLMAVELKTYLENSFACSLPGTLVFEVPTIHDLANYLATNVLGWQAEDTAAPEEEREEENRFAAVAEMSEAEVDASIAERLAKLESLIGGN